MRAIVIFGALISCFTVQQAPFAQSQNAPAISTITYSEFLQLPENAQAVYVAGIIDGESFVMHSIDPPDKAEWNKCVRKQPLGKLVEGGQSLRQEPPGRSRISASVAA